MHNLKIGKQSLHRFELNELFASFTCLNTAAVPVANEIQLHKIRSMGYIYNFTHNIRYKLKLPTDTSTDNV